MLAPLRFERIHRKAPFFMQRFFQIVAAGLVGLSFAVHASASEPVKPTPPASYTDPQTTDADFAFQGEYSGSMFYDNSPAEVGVQVVALGNSEFRGVFYLGGLPGAGWDGDVRYEAEGKLKDGAVEFTHALGSGRVRDGQVFFFAPGETPLGKITKVQRTSATLGKAPPQGAVVLFDGKDGKAFKNARLTPEHLLMEGADSLAKFGDCSLHLEFRLPYMPAARGQGRGNSGCYLQSRYEVQLLDSFGLAGKDNECGGLYGIRPPSVNMCLPPLTWQTYDIEFRAARFDAAGKKTEDARITVRHNDVEIQKDVTLPKTTTSAPLAEGPDPGPLHLQNHGNPVRFRNIWIVERK